MRLYDCFTFFNELDLLEIRLNILDATVDHFVLVEATRTHQNNPKPLHFAENKKRFERFAHKLTHIIVEDYPEFPGGWKEANSWDIERHQRNCIARGLTNCSGDDLIMISDLDEIPDPKKIHAYRNNAGIQVFEQRNFYYFINSMNEADPWWYGTVMARFADFRKPQDLRSVSKKMHGEKKKILNNKLHRIVKSIIHPIYRHPISIIPQAGWHFSYLGGVDKIIEKLEAFAHTEHNQENIKSRESIAAALQEGKDFVGLGIPFKTIALDETYPEFILNNVDTYRQLIR